jgi:hypothetical protein
LITYSGIAFSALCKRKDRSRETVVMQCTATPQMLLLHLQCPSSNSECHSSLKSKLSVARALHREKSYYVCIRENST